MKKSVLSAFILACGIFIFAGVSHAESYVSGYLGAVIPHESDWNNNQGAPDAGSIEFDAGFALGAKAGHWFTEHNAPYLGLEIDLNAHYPSLDRITFDTFGVTLSGDGDMQVYSASVNAIVRYPDGDIRPYGGFGIGWFFGNLDDGSIDVIGPYTGDDDDAFGWQLLAGVDYNINPNLSVFAEYKYTRADFEFTDPAALGIDLDYSVSQLYAGVSYHF